MPKSREFVRGQIRDQVKKKIRDTINNAIIANFGGNPQPALMTMIQAGLMNMQRQDVIKDFKVDSVEVTPHKPFREVDYLPITALPGDPLYVNRADENGELVEEYRGVIISADGKGNGIVLSHPAKLAEEGQVLVRCSIRPMASIETIIIEVNQEY